MYHRIADVEHDPWGMCVSPQNFEAQLKVIKSNGCLLTLEELLSSSSKQAMPENAIAITFDDGYLDNLTCALPILEANDAPATLYATTCNTDTPKNFWWDELETIILGPAQLPEVLALSVEGKEFTWRLGQARNYSIEDRAADQTVRAWAAASETRLGVYYQVWKTLWPLPAVEKQSALNDIRVWANCGLSELESRRSLTSSELRLVDDSGYFHVGAHTNDHPLLPSLDVAKQRQEIASNQSELQKILNRPIQDFAYPHGDYSSQTIEILSDLGFKSAVTVQQKLFQPGCDPMQLPRFGVKNLDGQQFENELLTWRARSD